MGENVQTTVEWFNFGFTVQKATGPIVNDDGSEGIEEIDVLCFQNPETGDIHKFHFGAESRAHLLKALTGGLILPP